MASPRRAGGLQLNRDPDFHRRLYTIQRHAWRGMALLVVAGLLGLFGSGPLSRSAAESEDGALRVEHERFARQGARSTLRVRLQVEPGAGGAVRLSLNRGALDRVRLDGITPEPARAESGPGGITFAVEASSAGGGAVVTIDYTPEHPGPIRWRVERDGGPPVRFWQFVYP